MAGAAVVAKAKMITSSNNIPIQLCLKTVEEKEYLFIFADRPQIVEFLRKQEDFVDLMIKHIGTSAIMDLLLRMLTCIEPQQLRQDVLSVSCCDRGIKQCFVNS